MTADPTEGTCRYCGDTFTRQGMTRHLRACEDRSAAISGAGAEAARTYLHLEVRDAYSGEYWLHLEMAGPARLAELDAYLRRIWLECCGHLSRFTIGDPWRGKEVPMDAPAGRVFHDGRELAYMYDFGTSTELSVRHVDERSGAGTADGAIALLARNEPPELDCQRCEEPAAWLCMQCVYEDESEGTLCEGHAEGHPHTGYGPPLPVVNSPRMGMCGYTGPPGPVTG